MEHTTDCKSPYILDNNLLSWSKNTRDVEITLDSKLTFNLQISSIVHNAHIRARLIFRSFTTRDKTILMKAFITYVRPSLEYCTQVYVNPDVCSELNRT